jgi:hypothetical protein
MVAMAPVRRPEEGEVLVAQERPQLPELLVLAAMVLYQPFQVHQPLTLEEVAAEVNLEEFQ